MSITRSKKSTNAIIDKIQKQTLKPFHCVLLQLSHIQILDTYFQKQESRYIEFDSVPNKLWIVNNLLVVIFGRLIRVFDENLNEQPNKLIMMSNTNQYNLYIESSLALSDGRIVCGVRNGSILFWNPITNLREDLVWTNIDPHYQDYAITEIIQNSNIQIISTTGRGIIRVWSLGDKSLLIELTCDNDYLVQIRFERKQNCLVAMGQKFLFCWNLRDYKRTLLHAFNDDCYRKFDFLPDGRLLISDMETIWIWDLTTLQSISCTPKGRIRYLEPIDNGNQLIVAHADGDDISVYDSHDFSHFDLIGKSKERQCLFN